VIEGDAYFTLMADADGVGFVHCGDGVMVIPLTEDGQVLLARERSPAFDDEVLGWRAGRIDYLGELHPFKYLTSRQFVFLARDLSPARLEGDERHPVHTRKAALGGFLELCAAGELRDAPTIAALCLAQEFLSKERR
jgi:hypothetical protein